MKKIWRYLKQHIQQDFNWGHYTFIFFFLAVSLTFNYAIDLQNHYLASLNGYLKFVGFFLLYATAYFTATSSYAHFYKRKDIFNSKDFWIKSALMLIVLTRDNSTQFLQSIIGRCFPHEITFWVNSIAYHLNSVFTIVIPLLVYYIIKDKNEGHVYGLRFNHIDFRPYFLMLVLMMPLIIIASYDQSFLYQYPRYKPSSAYQYLGIPQWIITIVYELAYGSEFISVELLFRGFLVIGMMSILGRNAVLTMAVVYCFLHFGKPPGEAVSSIFGGYILGVIAYETKSIWGGIIIHIGVAWSMELAAYLQKA